MSVSGQLLRPHVTESYVDGEWPDELLIEQNHVVSGQLSGAQPEGAKQFETGHSDATSPCRGRARFFGLMACEKPD